LSQGVIENKYFWREKQNRHFDLAKTFHKLNTKANSFNKWLLDRGIFTQKLSRPPKGPKQIFSNIGFIVFKRSDFAMQFQRCNRKINPSLWGCDILQEVTNIG
jgi:hypothetical protein